MKHQVTRLFAILLSLLTVCSILPLCAFCDSSASKSAGDSTTLENLITSEYYIEVETEIAEPIQGAGGSKTRGGRTTMTGKSSVNGEVLWTVTLVATFFYDGTTSYCKTSDVYVEVKSGWKKNSATTSKTGRVARCDFSLARYVGGVPMEAVNKYMTLTCLPDGTIT